MDSTNRTEEIQAPDGGLGRGTSSRGRILLGALLSALFLLSSLPLGLFWCVVLGGSLLMGLPLTVLWAGLPAVALAAAACAWGVGVERRRLGALLGVRLPPPFRPPPRGPILDRVRGLAADPALWRGLLYLLLLLPVGLVELVVVLVPALAAFLVSYPLWFWTLPDGWGFGWTTFFLADTVPEALLVMFVGLVVVAAAAVFAQRVARTHASLGRTLLGPRGRDGLEERVEALTQSRSRAVEAAIAERRRIERDLHDGAQQRLVSLAMALGLARQKLERSSDGEVPEDPEAALATARAKELQAAELVGEAHEEAKRALAEIRGLIRGIHPAVLTDRGLDAAISGLAGRSPVFTSVDVELDERPSEATEIAAYFVINEALVNVARHSGAARARVLVRREGGERGGRFGEGLLVAEVEDDGRGGADPAGTGLAGLAARAAALDGRLTVESPAGGPTMVRAELPWGHPSGDQYGG